MISKRMWITKLFFITLAISNLNAQGKIELILRTNLGFGIENINLFYRNSNSLEVLSVSPGGGGGAEIGLGYLLNKNIVAYSSIGYHQHLTMQCSSTNGFCRKNNIYI